MSCMPCTRRSQKEDSYIAFRDITKVFYDGKIKLDYKDKAHRYYARPRINWDLPESDPKAWGKIMYPKGVTTLIGDTLEKKGLMQWPKNVALRELFGYYGPFEIEEDDGSIRKMPAGFSKGVGTLWSLDENDEITLSPLDKDNTLAVVDSAAKGWQRKQKKGADIGSVVHDAIEHFIKGREFDIAENYAWSIKECEYDSEALRLKAMEEFDEDVAMATKAFLRFQKWWYTANPILHSAEDILYSLEFNICGTYDADLSIPIEQHPVFGKGQLIDEDADGTSRPVYIRCVTDWKTSNASKSKEAAMPEGIGYSYFLQDALYELMRRELGLPPADDLLVVSARKDGEFTLIYASECGLTVEECVEWAKAVIFCYRIAEKTKKGLIAHAKEAEVAAPIKEKTPVNSKEEF